MGWLKKLFGAPAAAAEGAAGVVMKTAEGVNGIVERWKPSETARHEMSMAILKLIADSTEDARKYDPRTVGRTLFSEIINVTVDGVSRAIRPSVTILLLGAIFGWWEIRIQEVPEIVQRWAETVFLFWFGSRAIIKDIPALVRQLRG